MTFNYIADNKQNTIHHNYIYNHFRPLINILISRNVSEEQRNDIFLLFLSILVIHMENVPIADQSILMVFLIFIKQYEIEQL
jgi:hypothetical protein